MTRTDAKRGGAVVEAPLTARSVLLSLLLGTDPPRLPVSRLVRAAGLFGIQEGTTRTALSRMAATGEVAKVDGRYVLTADRLLARQARQAESRLASTGRWRKRAWVMAVVAADGPRSAADRSALRGALASARLAELREGVWLRPDNVLSSRPPRRPESEALEWLTTIPEADDTSLARRLWDLDGWAEGARRLEAKVRAMTPSLEQHDTAMLADGFVASAAVLRHLQADPLLPEELLPPGWPGTGLRSAYDRFDRGYRALLRSWLAGADSHE